MSRPRIDEEYLPLIGEIKSVGYEVVANLITDYRRKQNAALGFEDFEAGEKNDLTPVTLTFQKCLVLSDIHLPYHDKSAIEKAVKKGKDRNADCIYLNGDIMDCYQISKHQKDKRKRSLKYEIDLCKEFFRILRLNFPNADIYYKFGNHESRYDRYLSENAEALKEFEEIQLDELLQLNNYGIKLVPANILAKAYDLYIAHGHEYKTVFASGFYAARNTRIRSGGANIITGHHHRPMMDTGVDIAGERSTVNCLGCLCDLSPDWLGLTQWQHGFGFIEQAKNKTNVENIVL